MMNAPRSILRWREIPVSVWALGLVSLFMDVSSEMIHALLPLYLVTVLGTSTLTVGIIEGIAEATASITKVFSGALSDYLGKRKWLAAFGYGLAAFTKPIFPLATPARSSPARYSQRLRSRRFRWCAEKPQRSHHHGEPLRRPGDAGVEPALAAVGKREALVEQHHVVPLRALRLVHGEHVAVVELVIGFAARPIDLLDAAGKTFRPHRYFDAAQAAVVVRQQPHGHDPGAPRAALLHRPQRAIEQALLAVVAQADQLVPGRRQLVLEAAAFAHSDVVSAPRRIAPDQHLVGLEHALRIEIVLSDHFGLAVAAGLEIFAGANVHRQPNDWIARGLPVHLGEHRVRLGLGEKSAALDRRQLRRVAQHQQRHAERQQVAGNPIIRLSMDIR